MGLLDKLNKLKKISIDFLDLDKALIGYGEEGQPVYILDNDCAMERRDNIYLSHNYQGNQVVTTAHLIN